MDKNIFFCHPESDPGPDPLVRGTDPDPRIPNTDFKETY